MASVKVKRVVSRYNASFRERRKTIEHWLKEVRSLLGYLYNKGGEESCEYLETMLPGTMKDVKSLRDCAGDLLDECINCMYSPAEDRAAQWPHRALQQAIDSVCDYFEHLQRKLYNRSPKAGLQSVKRNARRVMAVIDDTKKLNNHFGAIMAAYLKSSLFDERCRKLDSDVAVKRCELSGTKEQLDAFFQQYDVEPERPLLPPVVQETGAESSDDSVRIADESDDNSDSYDSGSDDDSQTDSDEALEDENAFVEDLRKNKAQLVKDVDKNGIVRGGRVLRKRHYERVDMHAAHDYMPLLADLDARKPKKRRLKKRAKDDDDDTRLSTSDEDSILDSLVQRGQRQLNTEKQKKSRQKAKESTRKK